MLLKLPDSMLSEHIRLHPCPTAAIRHLFLASALDESVGGDKNRMVHRPHDHRGLSCMLRCGSPIRTPLKLLEPALQTKGQFL